MADYAKYGITVSIRNLNHEIEHINCELETGNRDPEALIS